ncbi:MAG: TonB-dependent receptor, partial [Bacteroidota bacterium]
KVLFTSTGMASAGKAVAGVTVVEKGTRRGTSTNNEGKYSLTYSSPDATIVFSMVGYKKQEIKAEARTELNVMMVEGLELGEVLVVGSRSMNRSVIETPVPVDVLDLTELTTRLGQFDVNQVLQYAAPSFNANRQSGADGADHIDPASLRGLGPDQTLGLINGKRRHQSSLINIFGSRGRGNTGTDLNAIPTGAIERVEILRDGASAQYGSDAIAGVVNAVLKSTVNEFTGSISTGVHRAKGRPDRDYDGEEFQASGNYGIPVGNGGFLNMTMDYLRKGRTNRPADPKVYSIYRKQFGDASLQNYGAFFNLRVPVSERVDVYGFGGFNYRYTDAFAWTRDPDSERNVPAIYPNGFDPHITSKITDPSLSVGLRTNLGSWNVDLNNTFGLNRFHYTIKGTLNASLQEKSPTQFDAGGFQLWQNTAGVNFTRFFSEVENGLNVAFGLEYRAENYEIFAGEEGSWKSYGTLGLPAGSQGFPGFRPANILDETRTNVGAYADVELDVTKQFMIGGAARFENYSDFGSTVNVKAASRLKLSDEVALRGSVSTGFRAPTLAQIFFNSTFTDFVAGVPIDKFIAKNNSPLTRALGIPELKEETAQNASVGLTANLAGGFTATIDGYYVKIKDRIVLTGAFGDDDPDIGPDLQALGVGAAQFFTNALDTRTFGLDVIATYTQNIEGHQLRFSLAGNFNDMELGAIKTTRKLAGKEDIYFGRREQHFLLASAPKNKMSATFDYSRDRFHGSLRLVRFGKVTLIDWLDTEDIYEAKVTTDLSLAFDITKNASLVFGSANLFNEYPSQQDTETETGGLWDAVQMGFAGRFYYARVNFRF